MINFLLNTDLTQIQALSPISILYKRFLENFQLFKEKSLGERMLLNQKSRHVKSLKKINNDI